MTSLSKPRATALLLSASLLACTPFAQALGEPQYVTFAPIGNGFTLTQNHVAAPLVLATDEWPGVRRAATDLASDIQRVSGTQPKLIAPDGAGKDTEVVLIGTIGHSTLIDGLIRAHQLDVTGIEGHWETAVTTIVDHPMPGVRRALVIAGADKRGTIFGIYDLSVQIGVSPWYWWADVRIPHHDALFVTAGRHTQPEPAVRYRGIFLNDEAPSLSGWTHEKFGGVNSKFYVHVFELLLRLKANYLWPAMWGNAFNEDDPENPRLADEYGIVMGTSHHEPMLRAQQEWKRHGAGPWDYAANATVLQDFWRKGIDRNKNYESTITVGMRGDGDMPMSADANVALLEKIVADQRKILAANMTPQIASEPKVWAIYKEVQDYYEKGMRVPDDITLLWCDDNWGNIRRLPTPDERRRPGGAGIYYHFDYVGDPRSYKWLNTYSITKVWEQMNLALHYGADRIWIVNVGDLKPMEFPIEFFLTMARTPALWDQNHLDVYTQAWAAREFGPEHAAEIATAITDYTKYNARRKPEQLTPSTFSVTDFDEAGRVDREWKELSARVDKLAAQLPEDQRASFFELVQYPADASATVAEMYIAAGRNHVYAQQGRAEANSYAEQTRRLFAKDAALADEYNHKLLSGKWDHMMDQTHIGYTSWDQPKTNVMPEVVEVKAPRQGELALALPNGLDKTLGSFDSISQQTRSLTLFNRGLAPVAYTATTSAPWIVVAPASGSVASHEDLTAQIDWNRAPSGSAKGTITITPAHGAAMQISLEAQRMATTRTTLKGFAESDGYVAIDAADTTSRTNDGPTHWEELSGFGETKSAMTIMPVDAPSNEHSRAALEYRVRLTEAGEFTLHAVLAPTLNFVPGRGLRFSVSMDEGPRKMVDALAHNTDSDWKTAVSDGVKKVDVPLTIPAAGEHTLKIWVVDPGVVIERLVLSHGTLPPSYLGPPESFHQGTAAARP